MPRDFDFDSKPATDTFLGKDLFNSTGLSMFPWLIYGTSSSDTLAGTSENNTIFAQAGDDQITASAGNDYIDGGDGIDTVTYAGSMDDYEISTYGPQGAVSAIVTSTAANAVDSGKDLLNNIEKIHFAGDGYTLMLDGTNNAVLMDDDTISADADTLSTTDAANPESTTDVAADVDEAQQQPTDARINEIHYDNVGKDTGEFVEVRVAAGTDVTGMSMYLYNGSTGKNYRSELLSDMTKTTDGGHDYYVWTPGNIRNGSDGMALVGADGAVIEFLSYGNSFTATRGPADGMTATDIGVAETSSTAAGSSLQRNEDGSWRAPEGDTASASNDGVTTANTAPELSVSSNVTVDENTTEVAANVSATDVDGDDVSFSLSGADAALFTIDAATGEISFNNAPDFEAPGDADGDNAYELTVAASDGMTSTTQDITVTVADVNEAQPLEARINEIHYDNAGADTGEFVEVRVAAGSDTSGLSLELYNGDQSGALYGTHSLPDTPSSSDGIWDYYVVSISGIQNGAADGIALVSNGTALEFLSYEGTLTASGGAADGMTSTDIGVSEGSSTPVGQSLQRNEDGTWRGPEEETRGASNDAEVEPEFRINEVHYDNAGADSGEFVEVRVTAGADVSGMAVELRNGSNGGEAYNTESLSNMTMSSDGEYDYYVWEPSSIQNGASDGIALVDATGEDVEFLSYEGTFNGSTDIGVAESNSTPVGESLQRNDDGTWSEPATATPGAANENGTTSPPVSDITYISTIQGDSFQSPLDGKTVTAQAIVTHITEKGFFMQEEESDYDNNAATSEGIFVYTGGGVAVSLGDLVNVTGTVGEYYGSTQLSGVAVTTLSSGNSLPSHTTVNFGEDTLENFEGMLVSVTTNGADPLTVIENYSLARYGQVVLSEGSQVQPTQIYDPQTEAAQVAALKEENANNRLVIDDGISAQNQDAFEFIANNTPGDNGNGYLDKGDDFSSGEGPTLRIGAEVNAPINGVLTYEYGDYTMFLDEGTQLSIDPATNTRDASTPDVGGTLQVASFNVLNYFATIDTSGAGTGPNGDLDPRGADTLEELQRQTDKLANAMQSSGAEIFAIQEIENGGFGAGSAPDLLVNALNALDPPLDAQEPYYAYVGANELDTQFIGTDAITTGIIYDQNAVSLINADFLVFAEPSAADTLAIANQIASALGIKQLSDYDRNRPSVAATFEDLYSGKTFTVVSSHFKSKGDSGLADIVDAAKEHVASGGTDITQAQLDALLADPNVDQGDGQGYWNGVRSEAAAELRDWITNTYEGDGLPGAGESNVLFLGDMNSYAKEDPVQSMVDNGLTDLVDQYIGQDQAFSYVYDGQRGTLDQAFADSEMAGFVTGAGEWHINAPEPGLWSYDNSYNPSEFYNPDPFAASDHDPILVGLDFGNSLIMG